MSAIAGIVYFDERRATVDEIAKMTASMSGRGPDGIYYFVKGSVGMGQCLFRTTPESKEESLPLSNEDASIVLVMDGRVDNYKELRQLLLKEGAKLRSRADSELILRAYESWGEECATRIIGECVFVIFDAKQRCLFGCRDAAGTRHFYTHAGRGWFAFASEIGALLTLASIDRSLNEYRMLDFLVNDYDRDDQIGTFYKQIDRLPAGHTLHVKSTGARVSRYWDPRNLPLLRFSSEAERAEAFLGALKSAIECRLRSLGPVGAMLSGGLDSSSIVALLQQDFASALNGKLRTFTLVRENQENCAEWRAAQLLVQDTNTKSTVIKPSVLDEQWEALFREATEADEPHGLLPGLTNSLVFQAAKREGCSVVFDGIAADSLFWSAGRSLQWALSRRSLTDVFAVLVGACRYYGVAALADVSKEFIRPFVPPSWLAHRRLRMHEQRFSSGDLSLIDAHTARAYEAERTKARLLAREVDRTGRNPNGDLFVSGCLSFAHEVYGGVAYRAGVDPRSPFSDRRLIEFAVQMPDAARAAMWRYKQTLRLATASRLPHGILVRGGEQGHPGSTYYDRLARHVASSAIGRNRYGVSVVGMPKLDETALQSIRKQILVGNASEDVNYRWLAAEVLHGWLTTDVHAAK